MALASIERITVAPALSGGYENISELVESLIDEQSMSINFG
jgi:hypothetical protein